MSRASQERKRKRAMKAAGVAVVARHYLHPERVNAETLTAAVEITLDLLDEQGADLTGHLAITIGTHPEHPGRTTVEAKASAIKLTPPEAGRPDPEAPSRWRH